MRYREIPQEIDAIRVPPKGGDIAPVIAFMKAHGSYSRVTFCADGNLSIVPDSDCVDGAGVRAGEWLCFSKGEYYAVPDERFREAYEPIPTPSPVPAPPSIVEGTDDALTCRSCGRRVTGPHSCAGFTIPE